MLANDRACSHGSQLIPFLFFSLAPYFTCNDSDPVRIWSHVSWSCTAGYPGCPMLKLLSHMGNPTIQRIFRELLCTHFVIPDIAGPECAISILLNAYSGNSAYFHLRKSWWPFQNGQWLAVAVSLWLCGTEFESCWFHVYWVCIKNASPYPSFKGKIHASMFHRSLAFPCILNYLHELLPILSDIYFLS